MVGERQVLLHFVKLGELDDRDRIHLTIGNAGLQRGVDLGPVDGHRLPAHAADHGLV